MSWIAAATGMATSAPTMPSRLPPMSTASTVVIAGISTARRRSWVPADSLRQNGARRRRLRWRSTLGGIRSGPRPRQSSPPRSIRMARGPAQPRILRAAPVRNAERDKPNEGGQPGDCRNRYVAKDIGTDFRADLVADQNCPSATGPRCEAVQGRSDTRDGKSESRPSAPREQTGQRFPPGPCFLPSLPHRQPNRRGRESRP